MLIVRGSSTVFGANYCVRGIQIEFRWLTLNWWCVNEHWVCFEQIERKNPSPSGNFFVGWFPNQEPGETGPNLKNNPQNWSILGFILQQVSSSSGFLVWKSPNKETPQEGGGVSFDQNGHGFDVDVRLVNMGDCIQGLWRWATASSSHRRLALMRKTIASVICRRPSSLWHVDGHWFRNVNVSTYDDGQMHPLQIDGLASMGACRSIYMYVCLCGYVQYIYIYVHEYMHIYIYTYT